MLVNISTMMTNWQWRVILALIRTILRMNNVDIHSIYKSNLIMDDEHLLIEAVTRGFNTK